MKTNEAKFMIKVFPSGQLGNQLFQLAAATVLRKSITNQAIPQIVFHNSAPNLTSTLQKISNEKIDYLELLPFRAVRHFKLRNVLANALYSIWWNNQLRRGYRPSTLLLENDISAMRRESMAVLTDYYQDFNWVQSALQVWNFDHSLFSRNLPDNVTHMAKNNPVGLHMRFGDYLDEENRNSLGELDSNYYDKAIELIDNLTGEKKPIWIFTDDPAAAQTKINPQHLKRLFPVANFSLTTEQELVLLSLLKTKIISNSTFSWWGGYLSDKSSVVVSPDPLMISGHAHPARDPKWIKIPATYNSVSSSDY